MAAKGLAHAPDTADSLAAAWTSAMLGGDFERAWQINDRIRRLGLEDPHRFWQGEAFAGKRVMLRCLHGFGDSVQFLRYLPRLRSLAASVCVEVAPPFVELARCLDGVDNVITWGEAAPALAPAWDVQMEVMELPYLFRTQQRELPIALRYLRVPAGVASYGTGSALRVGMAWAAGEWNPARSIPFDCLRPLLDTAGCQFWNLGATLAPPSTCNQLHEEERCRESLLRLAQRIACLDLVITVDTLAAHLAGAMGTPAWMMLQHAADWRWMEGRDDSPWYPSLRLFRQTVEGDWPEVVARVGEALRRFSLEQRKGIPA